MFCIQEKDSPHTDPFSSSDKDPLSINQTDSSDDEPQAKRLKTSYTSPSLNLKVYQIPAFNTPKSLSIFPSNSDLPQFVNNPLNLANPLEIARKNLQNGQKLHNGNSIVQSLHSRYSLPSKLTITPVSSPVAKVSSDPDGGVIRYKKNGEVAKKRGPPKGYKRKPKTDLSQSLDNGSLVQSPNASLSNLLAATNTTLTALSPAPAPAPVPVVPQIKIKVPEGTELVELELEPADWFPEEPYRMSFNRKKNPKWKAFPFRCEHCFKGYRVASTLITHAAERHGSLPAELAIPCPCCPHVSTRRKQHKKHLESHHGRKHRLFCPYCLPLSDPNEPYVKESEKYPYDKFPQYWYASEESLRLHKKRKHPYSGMYNISWFGTWGEAAPNS